MLKNLLKRQESTKRRLWKQNLTLDLWVGIGKLSFMGVDCAARTGSELHQRHGMPNTQDLSSDHFTV